MIYWQPFYKLCKNNNTSEKVRRYGEMLKDYKKSMALFDKKANRIMPTG